MAPQSPRTYHHGDLRRKLLASARQLLEEGGPAALTLWKAARRVGAEGPSLRKRTLAYCTHVWTTPRLQGVCC